MKSVTGYVYDENGDYLYDVPVFEDPMEPGRFIVGENTTLDAPPSRGSVFDHPTRKWKEAADSPEKSRKRKAKKIKARSTYWKPRIEKLESEFLTALMTGDKTEQGRIQATYNEILDNVPE